jgi:hypothetical protein
MKPTVTTALSVAGVLAAGALAIAANTAVFAEPDVAPVSGVGIDQPVLDVTVAPAAPASDADPAADLFTSEYSHDEVEDDEVEDDDDELSGQEDTEDDDDAGYRDEPEEGDDGEVDDD